jgi:mRNA-degrading endonuclease YafQ of YafQ-DinJ toxin-antitoxin module
MFKLIFTHSYEEKVKKFLKKHPEVEKRYTKTLQLLELNPFHPSLRLHQFKTSNFEGYSISINLTYRISLEFILTEKEILLINIGDHKEIYGKK